MSGCQVDQVNILLEWCAANSIFIHSHIRIASDEQGGIGVHSTEDFIASNVTLVKVPKDAVLSVRTCSLAGLIPISPYGLGAQLSLSIALYVEILRGTRSRWHGYLQSLPEGVVDLPLFWCMDTNTNQDGLEALVWLRGTEAAKILETRTENNLTTLEEINHFYHGLAKPLLLQHVDLWQSDAADRTLTLQGFYLAFSLVSSRAFLVDAYHGLSMVPIADVFNHVLENHVHLESDYNVCPECGSLHECPHDSLEGDVRTIINLNKQNDNHDLFYEMVSNRGIPPLTEVFNTYGEDLTNAQLLNQYGFVLDVNENDHLSWTLDEILPLFLSGDLSEIEKRDLIGYFHDILSPLDKTHPIFTRSQLVYYEVSADCCFCLNDEGSLSHQLWAILFILSLRRRRLFITEPGLHQTLQAVLELQMKLETSKTDDEDGTTLSGEGSSDKMLGQPDPLVLKVLFDVGQMSVALCTERKRNGGRPESGTTELSSVMEDIADDSVRTHLALTVLVTERSILDCCEAEWGELMKSIALLLHELD